MKKLMIAIAFALVAQQASAQCAGERVNYFWRHNCIPCTEVKAFLDRNRVRYDSYHIGDPAVQQYMREHFNYVSSPVVESKGRHVSGYDERALRELICQ